MGADFIDYIIADKTVAPFDQQPFYTEKIVHLPDSYQVNDSRRKVAEHVPSRAEAGLPEHGFVFCCFNNNYKITAAVFELWMRLLKAVPGSLLWLLRDNPSAESNLRREAQVRGVDPSRLVFARRVKLAEHLARHRFADLFLDTLSYNAHTTASDALWVGVPVLTCEGHAFAGRVAPSLLRAVGLSELVTRSLEEYAALKNMRRWRRGLQRMHRSWIRSGRNLHRIGKTIRYSIPKGSVATSRPRTRQCGIFGSPAKLRVASVSMQSRNDRVEAAGGGALDPSQRTDQGPLSAPGDGLGIGGRAGRPAL